MTKIFLARGARGTLVEAVQTKLSFPQNQIDGDYGAATETAVGDFQQTNHLTKSGRIDSATWHPLMKSDPPSVRDRALQVTAAFEGTGFTLAEGNFDGAGITWGIVGFTLMTGDLGKILKRIDAHDKNLLPNAFGADNAKKLLHLLDAPATEKRAFADSVSLGASKEKLAEPWRTGFRNLGSQPAVQQIQLDLTDEDYFQPARTLADRFGLKTELGIALAFDIQVQDGGIKASAKAAIEKEKAAHPLTRELDLRVIIAHAVADAASASARADVLSRKLTLATGAGKVHGEMFVLQNWGLDETLA